uniref:Uncharacterized protein n=1 Tax=Oryza barthii TaxID=65489 RepID=A0A0D3EJM1_9ORYZ
MEVFNYQHPPFRQAAKDRNLSENPLKFLIPRTCDPFLFLLPFLFGEFAFPPTFHFTNSLLAAKAPPNPRIGHQIPFFLGCVGCRRHLKSKV